MEAVPMVERVKGIPAASAAREPAYSPSDCIIRVKPVGAMPNGSEERPPRISVDVLTVSTLRRTEGRNSRSRKVPRARAREISASAAPSV
jgi:hypothetical protein